MFKPIRFVLLSLSVLCIAGSSLLSETAFGARWYRQAYYGPGWYYYSYSPPCIPVIQTVSQTAQPTAPQTRTAYYTSSDASYVPPVQPAYVAPAEAAYYAPAQSFRAPVDDTSAGRLPWTPSNSGWGGRGR